MKINPDLTAADLAPKLDRFWALSAEKIRAIEETYDPAQGTPVFTVEGRYTTRGWTEWTQGFQVGSALLQFDATGDDKFLELGRRDTAEKMAPHLTHTGVHDHGFNNVSTYGNLRRLMLESRIPENPWELRFYELALKCSAAVQASRWTALPGGGGFIYSFNGPHSLFVDTLRSCRALALGHHLGHALFAEGDRRVDLLERVLQHARTTADYSVYYGGGRDAYDVRGRTAHECVFNTVDGAFRCPNAQQGFSGFTTWTRGLAWAVLGFPEQLEYLQTVDDLDLESSGGRVEIEAILLNAARATADFFIENSAADGIPYWDTGAPGLARMGEGYLDRPADPDNPHEPVDSSAAAIAAQGLLRLGHLLGDRGGEEAEAGKRYWQAGLTVLDALFDEPYLSAAPEHQGLILHSVYHRPNGWDFEPGGDGVPRGESSLWGDYHAREAALYLGRAAAGGSYYTFFGPVAG